MAAAAQTHPVSPSGPAQWTFYIGGYLSAAFIEFKAILDLEYILHVGSQALELFKLLQLGQIEKGYLLHDAKYKSLSGHWFGCSRILQKGREI